MRNFLFVLSLIGLLSSNLVVAQVADPAEFFPYHPGNEWEYVQIFADLQEDTEEVTGYTRVAVLRDTVVSGLPGAVFTVTRLNDLQEQYSEIACTGYLDGSEWRVSPTDCLLGNNGTSGRYLLWEVPGGSIEVGGETYSVPRLSNFGIPCGTGSGGTFCGARWKHAGGIGLYYWHEEQQRAFEPSYHVRDEGRLIHARTGDETYGAPLVANEPASGAAPGALTVEAFPNPSRDYIQVSITAATTGSIELALYDTLGRRVWVGQGDSASGAVLNVGSLPRGLYVLRAQSPSGAIAITRVVRLD